MRRRSFLALPATLSALAALPRAARAEADTVHISHGLGVLYLPLIVMREAKLMEAELDKAGIKSTVSWVVMDGGGQINDAMLAGALDIAGTSIPGFLTLWSKGRGTRSEVIGVSGLSTCALILNTNRPYIHSLADFKPDDKIAVPSIKSSLQAVVLQMAVAKTFGDANWAKLDGNTITMQHPLAVQALIAGKTEVAAHFASPPFTLAEAKAPNIHPVLRSPDILGDITLDMVFAAKRFTDSNPGHVKAFLAAQRAANKLIADDPARATQLFIQNSGSKIDPEEILGVSARPPNQIRHRPPRLHAIRRLHAPSRHHPNGSCDMERGVCAGAGGHRT